MTNITLEETSTIYVCAESFSVQRHRVLSPLLTAFSRKLKRFRASLGDEAEDDFWRDVMWRCFWYRKLVSSAPIPPADPCLMGQTFVYELKHHLRNCQEVAPRFAESALQLLNELELASAVQDNPVLETIVDVLDYEEPEGVGIIVADQRLLKVTQGILDRTPVLSGAEAVHVSELRSGKTFQRLFFVGAGEWYGRGALSAPRAPTVDLIRYSFVRDTWRPERLFVGRQVHTSYGKVPRAEEQGDSDSPEDDCDIVDAPSLEVESVVRKIGGEVADDASDFAIAKLVLLEGGAGVFLDASPDSRAFVIDLQATGEDRVERLPVNDLERGAFLLLRTAGGGDYIAPEADRIMGRDAAAARKSLDLWKSVLRNRVGMYDAARVAAELNDRGAHDANANDVRRWMSSSTIGTSSEKNFLAIVTYAGMEFRYAELLRLMRLTQNAHKRAGRYIRGLLLAEVENADLRILQKMGVMEFALPGQTAGSLTAYRIQEVNREEVFIAPSRLSRPFNAGDASWLG